jgi:alkylhydroperoxidase family enzyme
MRLTPIDRPASLLGRVMSRAARKMFGRELTPARVVYNRVPRMWNVGLAIYRLERDSTLPRGLWLLLQAFVASANECAFCQDIARARAVRARLGIDRFDHLHEFASSALFTPAEKAALAYVEEVNRSGRAADATFDALRAHFDDRQIVEITLANAVEQFWNRINLPLEIESDHLEATVHRAA